MTDIKSMTLEELTAWLKSQGEPGFRAKQIFRWIYRGVTSFDEMTDLSKSLREKLKGDLFSYRAQGGTQAGVPAGRHHQIPVGAGGRQLH